MKRKLSTAVISGAALLLVFWIAGQLWGTRFEAYDVAVAAVMSDVATAEHIGKDPSARIAFFDGYRVTTIGTSMNAEYRLVIKGDKQAGIADVVLSREVGRWSLVEGNLSLDSGESAPLHPREITYPPDA